MDSTEDYIADNIAEVKPNFTFVVTLFKNRHAFDKTEQVVTVGELIELIRTTSAVRKGLLPLLKLARYGNRRTPKNSLRHNANVLEVYGVECDYDGEIVSFEEAVELVRKANVWAILYTSPSHTPDAPRWRVLFPFGGVIAPTERAAMADRANGIFGGGLAGETWTLSQAFFYGRVGEHFRLEVVDGDPLDTRPDIIGIGKPAHEPRAYSEGAPISIDDFRAAGEAAAKAAVDLPYPVLMPLIAATARVNVIDDDDRSVRWEVARLIRASTPGTHMDENRFLTAFDAPIREGQLTAGPATFFYYARIGGWVPVCVPTYPLPSVAVGEAREMVRAAIAAYARDLAGWDGEREVWARLWSAGKAMIEHCVYGCYAWPFAVQEAAYDAALRAGLDWEAAEAAAADVDIPLLNDYEAALAAWRERDPHFEDDPGRFLDVKKPPSPIPPARGLVSDPGIGKTEAWIERAEPGWYFSVPRHELGEEIVAKLAKRGLSARVYRGLEAEDPEAPGGDNVPRPGAGAGGDQGAGGCPGACLRAGGPGQAALRLSRRVRLAPATGAGTRDLGGAARSAVSRQAKVDG